MNLPNDFSRCMDAECPLSSQCARYLQRPGANPDVPDCWVPVAASMREEGEDCHAFIEEEK